MTTGSPSSVPVRTVPPAVRITGPARAWRIARRFLLPRLIVRLIYLFRHRTFIAPLAEVELSRLAEWGPRCSISSFTKIKIGGRFTMGARVQIATGCFIEVSAGGLAIGDDSLVGPNTTIVTSRYSYDRLGVPFDQQGNVSAGVRIGARVWIGANSVILDGSDIGDDCIISAASVVGGSVPAGSIVAGNPAKAVFSRR